MLKNLLEKKTVIYGLAVIESILFGMTFLTAKIALTELNAIQVLAARWTIAVIFLGILAAAKVIKVDYRGKKLWVLLFAALMQPGLSALGETLGIDLTTASESAIIYAVIPIAVVLISSAVLKDKIKPTVLLAIAMSFAGVVITVVFGDGFSMGGKGVGYLCLAVMVVTAAVFTIASNRISDRFTPMEITFAMALFGCVWFNLLALAKGDGFGWYGLCVTVPKVGLCILFMGVIICGICYIIFNFVMSKLPAPQASMLQVNLISLTGVLTGILILGDSFGWYTFVGLILVLGGVVLANKGDM